MTILKRYLALFFVIYCPSAFAECGSEYDFCFDEWVSNSSLCDALDSVVPGAACYYEGETKRTSLLDSAEGDYYADFDARMRYAQWHAYDEDDAQWYTYALIILKGDPQYVFRYDGTSMKLGERRSWGKTSVGSLNLNLRWKDMWGSTRTTMCLYEEDDLPNSGAYDPLHTGYHGSDNWMVEFTHPCQNNFQRTRANGIEVINYSPIPQGTGASTEVSHGVKFGLSGGLGMSGPSASISNAWESSTAYDIDHYKHEVSYMDANSADGTDNQAWFVNYYKHSENWRALIRENGLRGIKFDGSTPSNLNSTVAEQGIQNTHVLWRMPREIQAQQVANAEGEFCQVRFEPVDEHRLYYKIAVEFNDYIRFQGDSVWEIKGYPVRRDSSIKVPWTASILIDWNRDNDWVNTDDFSVCN